MISSGVKEEVENSMKPIQERQNGVEKAQADIKEQFREMVEEVKELKSNLQNPSNSNMKTSSSTLPVMYSSMAVHLGYKGEKLSTRNFLFFIQEYQTSLTLPGAQWVCTR